jgi:hypothetical protein
MNDARPIAIIASLIVLLVAGGAWWMTRRTVAPLNESPKAVTATDAPIDKPGEPPVPLPPLDQMDGFLRPLLAALSSRPELASWLATDDLVRQLAAAIAQASTGASPARDFRVLAPQTPFTTAGRPTARTIDPASYRRYNGLVATVTSIDASAVAKLGLRRSEFGIADADAETAGSHGAGEHRNVAGVVTRVKERASGHRLTQIRHGTNASWHTRSR